MFKKILSLSNPYIKQIVKIRKEKKFRESEKKALLIGKNAIDDLKDLIEIDTLIITDEALAKEYRSSNVLLVSESIMKKITNVVSPEKIACVIKIEKREIKEKNRILILDNVSDPGNMGTIIRTAYGFGFDLVIVSKNSTDPFSEKSLRASKGTIFLMPILVLSIDDILSFIRENKINTYLADLAGDDIDKIKFITPFAIILSNEALGASDWTKKNSTKFTIPLKNNLDSLNVATAGSICMYLAGKS
ncbi:MAG: RNA methyltransferase [Parachlamydiales bacterium]